MNLGSAIPLLSVSMVLATATLLADDAAIRRGELHYQQRGLICHGPEGRGVPNVFPPLAQSDWLTKNRERAIRALCEGLAGRIKVNGVEYEGSMPAQAIDDAATADVLNYVGTAWGNQLPPFSADEV